jgi:hypothetical protein
VRKGPHAAVGGAGGRDIFEKISKTDFKLKIKL